MLIIAMLALIMAFIDMVVIYQVDRDLTEKIREDFALLRTDYQFLRKDYIARIQEVRDSLPQYPSVETNAKLALQAKETELKKMLRGRPKPTPLPLKTIKEGRSIKKPGKKK
jgi:hypothetical protein